MNEERKEAFWQKIQVIRRKEALSIARTLIIAFIISVFLLPSLLLFEAYIAWASYFTVMLVNVAWLARDILIYEEQISNLNEKIS